MGIVVGIDEAGYGPLLGPLVVSGVAFECPELLMARSFWEVLRQSVTSQICRNDSRLPILDSKKLHTRGGGMRALERTSLVMLAAAGITPGSFRSLIQNLAPSISDSLKDYPWYRDFDPALPVQTSAGDIATRANAVRLDMASHEIILRQVRIEPLLEGHFNRVVESTRNKSTALVSQTLRILDGAFRASGKEPLRAVIDRQGGRSHYGQVLMTAFEGCELRIIEESESASRYELRQTWGHESRALRTLEFQVGGEEHHLATALASVISKYVRELFMMGFNAYWRSQMPDLHPTAGYYEDGQRFLKDIDAEISRRGIDRGMLVRSR